MNLRCGVTFKIVLKLIVVNRNKCQAMNKKMNSTISDKNDRFSTDLTSSLHDVIGFIKASFFASPIILTDSGDKLAPKTEERQSIGS